MPDKNTSGGDTSLHEDEYWVRQDSGVVVEDCTSDAKGALVDLGKWFFEKTGKKLVCTAGTNGQHASGEHCHATGWKLDLNDWYGPENLGGEYFGYPLDENGTSLLNDFIAYGHTLGLGMSIEGDHVDVQTDGYEWKTGENWGGYKNPNGRNPYSSVGGGGSASSPRTANMKDVNHMLIMQPNNKTFCEPMYPDYLYVAGNIPDSLTEKPAANTISPSIRRTDGKEQTDPYDYEYDNGQWNTGNNGSGSGKASSVIVEKAVLWCINIANDGDGQQHLYSQSDRTGPNYDCTSFISAGLDAAGLGCGILGGSSFDTTLVNNYGFKFIPWSEIGDESNLKRGDILTTDSHVELYIGGGQVVGAHSANKPAADQISVEGYWNDNWNGVLRSQ